MQSEKRKIYSPRNYRANTAKPEEQPPQQVDFSIFKRKSTENCSLTSEICLTVSSINHNFLAILGGLHLTYLKEHSETHLFKQIQLINVDRSFLQYLHQKTLLEFQRIFKQNFTSLDALRDILNHYPVASFFLDIYSRQFAITYLQNLTESEEEFMMGNQFQVLNDCSCEPRGNSLDILCKSLKINLNIKHSTSQSDKSSSLFPTDIDQVYGSQNSCIFLELAFGSKQVMYTIAEVKKYISPMKKSRVELLQRRSRARQLESGRTSTESRSITKGKVCEQCGKKRCKCAQLQVSQYSCQGINLSKSISGGFIESEIHESKNGLHRFKSLGMGFINVNKIVNRDKKN